MPIPSDQLAAYIVATITTTAAVFERLKNAKKDKQVSADTILLSEARMFKERAELMGQAA